MPSAPTNLEGAAGPLPADHPAVQPPKIGVILLNLGTPDATDYWSMRRYLSEFLSDRRVIDYSPWLWQPLLQGIILSVRPGSKGKEYAAIWNKERDESPLKTVTRAQALKVGALLRDRHPSVMVDWAMRYGNPSTASVMERMVAEGANKLLLLALYPQYAAPTTATAYDKAFDALSRMRWQPAIRTTGPWYDHPRYIELLADSIRAHYVALDFAPDLLVMSYHGVPKRYLLEGDPYHCHCQKTTRLVREALGWPAERLMICFQSRFGREEWLQPYLDKTLEALPAKGIKKLAVVSPAFVTDCLETLEEIAVTGQETFLHAGGERFTYISCLNDTDAHVAFLADLVKRELGGWV